MNRFVKTLSILMILIMLTITLPITAHASETGLSFLYPGYIVGENSSSSGAQLISFDLQTVLLYNGSSLSNAGVNIENVDITGINYGDEHFQKPSITGTSVVIPVNPNCHNKTRTLGAEITYTVNGETKTETLDFFAQVTSGISEDLNGSPDPDNSADPNSLQTKYDITLIPSPIAQDDKDGNIVIQMHLSYRGSKDFQHAPMSYFRIQPVVSTNTAEFPFELDYSAYEQDMGDIHVVYNEDNEVIDTYFEFPFEVRDDAINGFYAINFNTYHLYASTYLHEATPVETTLTTYVEIRNGKKAASDELPSSDPSTAILLLEGYTVEPQEIHAGDEFDLTLKIRNTSDRTVTDVKSTLSEANKTIMPVSGASSFFIEKIKAGETVEHTVRLKATSSAGVDPVELTLQNAFVQQDAGKTSSDTFILPVIQVSNLSLDPPSYPVEIYLGDSFNLMMSLYNKGKSRLYNVSVYLDSESMTADENYYAGNMESGTSKTYDVMVTPSIDGQIQGDIVVSFEDAEGNVTEKRTPITLNVATMDWMYEDPYPVMPDDMMVDVYPSQRMPPLWVWFAVGAGGLAAVTIVIVLVVRAKKRKASLVEDDDEMD